MHFHPLLVAQPSMLPLHTFTGSSAAGRASLSPRVLHLLRFPSSPTCHLENSTHTRKKATTDHPAASKIKMSLSSPEALTPLGTSHEGEGPSSVTRRPSLMSRLSSAVGTEGEPGNPGGLLRRLSTSLQFKRKGSSMPLPLADEIPATFLAACKGNVEKASKKWQASKEWRQENDIDHILERPHPNYDTLKNIYPAYLHGRDLQGNCISVEIPGLMDVKLMKAANLTPRDMVMHMALIQEYIWTELTPGEDKKIVTLMDAKGLSLMRLGSSDCLALIRAASETLNNHYPERVLRILVVNAPRFFGPIFKLLSTVMPASLRDQLQICSSLEDIEKFISLDVLPPEYGGKSPFKLGEAEEEVGLRALVMKNNAAAAAAGVVPAAST